MWRGLASKLGASMRRFNMTAWSTLPIGLRQNARRRHILLQSFSRVDGAVAVASDQSLYGDNLALLRNGR